MPLSFFHPLVGRWFRERVGTPTDVQVKSWPAIAAGEHVLVTAPTGSGKTLTAFLWAINQLVTEVWPLGCTKVLYVSPLKALNTDIRRNLLQPLAELEQTFDTAGQIFPKIRVETRSGDTPQAERRQMLRHPPEILITTPESLNLLLSSTSGRSILTSLSTVILDEIHTVINTKRGVHLITAVDRLVPLSGEFQRIAVSATAKPLEIIAEFIGGLKLEAGSRYLPRPVTIIRAGEAKKYELTIRLPKDGTQPGSADSFWPPYVKEFRRIIERNRSSLFFARSRKLCESITLQINGGKDRPIAYAHHGSLAKELRLEVENRLKSGDLKAIVATNSLELGIDIGALDEVVLVQSPPSISSAVQRVGRAGHRVGETSRGTFFPTHDQDFVATSVIARAVMDGDIESVRPVENALDVLAQVIISMAGTKVWDIDDLYSRIRTSWPYRRLSRTQFDLVLNMLAGRYMRTRIRELRPRVSVDRLDNTVTARPGALLSLFISGGTIPDRGYFHLRHEETGALIGELDEEFVWEASIGQSFTFGTQHWKIRKITHNEVFVLPSGPDTMEAPFWKGEVFNRNAYLSDKITSFLEEAEVRLEDPGWLTELEERYFLERAAAERLADFLKTQKKETGRALPHRHHLLVEHLDTGPGGAPGNQLVLHTFWGGQVNRPFALALDAAWEERYGYRIEIFPQDDCIVLQLPHGVAGQELFTLVSEANFEPLLRKRLEGSGYFGARFRECAGRALLLTRRKLGERLPLWMSRLRSQRLLQAVMKMSDFPILLETWRTCRRDEFDLEALRDKISQVASAEIRVSECRTSRLSPMARSLIWGQVNQYMYAGDELPADRASRLRGDLLRELVFTPGLRPAVSPETVRVFEEKRQRLSPGYAPAPDRELVDWIKERVLIPWPEWLRLIEAVRRDREAEESSEGEMLLPLTIPDEVLSKIARLSVSKTAALFVAARERLPEILAGIYPGAEVIIDALAEDGIAGRETVVFPRTSEEAGDELFTSLLEEWLQFYGPHLTKDIAGVLRADPDRLDLALEDLKDSESLITGPLVKDHPGVFLCDAENFETLLRLERASAVPRVEAKEIMELPLFLAHIQGLTQTQGGEERLFSALEPLVGYSLPAPLWESDIFPARVPDYSVSELDGVLQQGNLRWQGDEDQQVRFFFEDDLELLLPENSAEPEEEGATNDAEPTAGRLETAGAGVPQADAIPAGLFADPAARYDFGALLKRHRGDVAALEEKLWEQVWRGRVTNDTFSALRRGLQTGFRVAEAIERQKRSLEYAPRRKGLHLSRWREAQAYPGSWFLLPDARAASAADLIEQEERRKDRVRLLLDRYGLLFRELLSRERPPFRWPDVFRTLRLMELSGEILAGYFFAGIPGPQFMSQRGFRLFMQEMPQDIVYWMSAVDPASVCGVAVDALRGSFPKRVEGTHLVFCGRGLVMISQRKGRALMFLTPPNDPRLPDYLTVLRHFLTRQFNPVRRVIIETINDEPAPQSPYLAVLKQSFDVVVDINQVSLYRRVET